MVKTYKESAKLTLEESEIITKDLESEVEIEFDFNKQNQIFTLLNKFDGKILNFFSEEQCKIIAKINTSQKENISEQLSEMQNISFKFL